MAKRIAKQTITPKKKERPITSPSVVSTGNSDDLANIIKDLTGDVGRAIREMSSGTHWGNSGEGKISFATNNSNKLDLIGKIIRDLIPSTKQGVIKKAYAFYETDDFLNPLVEMQVDFSTAGFHLQPVPLERTKKAYAEINKHHALVDDFNRAYDFPKVVDQLFRDFFICDSTILYWKLKNQRTRASKSESVLFPELIDVNALDPRMIDWCNTAGMDVMKVFIHDDARKRIQEQIETLKKRNVRKREDIINQIHATGIGFKWVEAVYDKLDFVELSNDDNDFWLVETKARKYHGLAFPSMKNVFSDLTIRSFFQEGKVSAAYLFAFFIMMIKQGESITSGPRAGEKSNWLKSDDAKKLQKDFTSFSKAARMVMNHTTSVDWIYPPKDMFDEDRMTGPNQAVLNWGGFTKALFEGQGDNYSGGYLGIRKATAKIGKGRSCIDNLLSKFFHHPSMIGQTKILKKVALKTTFDENILKEPKLLLDEVKFLYENSISDQHTALRELGRNPESIKASTLQSKADQKELGVWSPIAEQGGKKSANKGGRPTTEGNETDEFTRNQTPSPRATENSSRRRKKVSTGNRKPKPRKKVK